MRLPVRLNIPLYAIPLHAHFLFTRLHHTGMPTKHRIFTISNGFSFLRVLLTIPCAVLLWQGHNFIALSLGVVAYITDLLDGWIARKLDEVTEAGKVIDPLADKIYVGVITAILVIQNKLPLWFVAAVIARDFVIMLAGLYIARRTGFVLPSNYPGKIAVFCMIVLMVCVVAELPPLSVQISLGAACVMLVLSFGVYVVRFVELLRNGFRIEQSA
jgi:cardiolipin synthase (CMP-forming)